MLEVQDLRIDMMVSTLIHGLKKGLFASALARDPPGGTEQLMELVQKYIDEEEMNAMKDNEWTRDQGRMKGERSKEGKSRSKKDRERRGLFHKDKGHDTEECFQLKDEIERLIRERSRKDDVGKSGARDNAPTKGIIHTLSSGPTGGDSSRVRKRYARESRYRYGGQALCVEPQEDIFFGDKDLSLSMVYQNDPMVIRMDIVNYQVHKLLMDNGSSVDIIFTNMLKKMELGELKLKPVHTPLVGFGGSEEPRRKTCMIQFLVVDSPFAYNVVLGRHELIKYRAVVSTYHLKMKFPTKYGIGEAQCDGHVACQCYNLSIKQVEAMKKEKRKDKQGQNEVVKRGKMERLEPMEQYKEVELILGEFHKTACIGSQITKEMEMMTIDFFRNNNDMFAWSLSDFRGIDPSYSAPT
ncbi:UNVERIFIED_CONTAM: hypothetical protein Sindi_1851300 [Sesamum indicum]